MDLSKFDFDLPAKLIAQKPYKNRTDCKLLFYNNHEIADLIFRDILSILDDSYVLVFNQTRVVNARYLFHYQKKLCEIFFLEDLGQNQYKVFLKKPSVYKKDKWIETPDFKFSIISLLDKYFVIQLEADTDLALILESKGQIPLPPYINTKNPELYASDYQTVYACNGSSVAAPTAGLHFDEALLADLKTKGVALEYLNLNVGLGTFGALTRQQLDSGRLHSESFELTTQVASRLNDYKKRSKKIIAVGTTTLRTLQSCYDFATEEFIARNSETDIFIQPPFNDFVVDGLLTNFHLPKSSLFMLISAFVGTKQALAIYEHAIFKQYLFYSFGDACLFLR